MSGDWFDGYGGEAVRPAPPAPAPAAPARATARAPVAVTCPQCGGDDVRVRSSARETTYLECATCGHGTAVLWKVARRVRRVLIVEE